MFFRHFKLEFQEFNAKYFQLEDTYTSVKNNMTELKKHDEQRNRSIERDKTKKYKTMN